MLFRSFELSEQSAVCVVMAANGYPGDYKKGTVIEKLDEAEALDGVTVFHAGTRIGRNCGKLKARSEERRVGKECRSRWSPYH